jgi:hypothetical protein
LHETVSDAEIGDAIRELPAQSWEHSLEVFYKNPEEATKLLIAELGPIKTGRYPGGTHPQAVRMYERYGHCPGSASRRPLARVSATTKLIS